MAVPEVYVPPSAIHGETPRADAAFREAMKLGEGSHAFALGWMLAFARDLECEIESLKKSRGD